MNHERLFARSVAAGDRTVANRIVDHLVVLQNVKWIETTVAIDRNSDPLGATGNPGVTGGDEFRLDDGRASIFLPILDRLVMRFSTGGRFPQAVIVGYLAVKQVSVADSWTENQPTSEQGQQRYADKQGFLHLQNLSITLIPRTTINFTGNIGQ